MKKFLALILMIAVCALWVIPAYAVISASMLPAQEWNFRVFLDENEIGYHSLNRDRENIGSFHGPIIGVIENLIDHGLMRTARCLSSAARVMRTFLS